MFDLHAIADVIRAEHQVGLVEKSEVAVSKTFLRHLGVFGKMVGNRVKPVATRGTLYLYNDESGTWMELEQDDALALIQCYDNMPVTRGQKSTHLELGPHKCKAIHEAATLDIDHRDAGFFDQAASGVAFKNGFVTVDADGPKLNPSAPEHRATHCMPYNFDPAAECPEWSAVIKRVFDGSPSAEDDGKLLQEFVGLCLIGRAWQYARCLILSGAGNNGKSAVVETITEHLFPSSAVTYTSPQSWAKPEYLSRLRTSTLNVANEMPGTDIQASDAFKAVIDGGLLTARDLYENPYTLRPRAGHIFLANDLPGTRDNSNGFWRRVLVLPFKRDFSKRPDESGKLRTKEEVKALLGGELAGIALWALWGAARAMRQGGYTLPTSHRIAVEEWRCDVDQVAAFLNECCRVDGSITHHGEIHRSFKEWCEVTGRQQIGNRKLAARLRALGIEDGADRNGLFFRMNVMMRASWGIGRGIQANA